MAIPISIDRLLDGTTVESARIEFKEGWNPEDIIHSICAFANDIDNWGGGYIIVGAAAKDGLLKRPVAGILPERLDKMQKDLLSLSHKIQPRYMPISEPVEYEGAWLLVIWVPGGYDRPYDSPVSLSKNKSDRSRYVRRFSSTVKASTSENRELSDLGGRVPFDDRVNHRASLADLERPYMEDFLREVGSSQTNYASLSTTELATALRVVDGPPENVLPLNVGLLMFSGNPEKFLPHARIEVVDIPDPTGEGMTEKVFRGPLTRQLTDALSYIRNYIIAERVFKVPDQAEAIRAFNYPYEAVEEALSNAVLHRGYSEYEPITVRVEPGQMSILSTPGPDRSIHDTDIKRNRLVSKRYRNRRIGEFLKELGLIEGRNTGVPTMIRALEDNGSEPPVFDTDEDRTYFEVTFKEHPFFAARHETAVENSPDRNEAPHAPKRRSRLELKEAALNLLASEDMSQSELARALGYQGASKALSSVVRELVEEGTLTTTGAEFSPKAKLHLQ
ncbi:MAG: AAA family ATPase [Adlercreutzia sp.]|nr:AAA family ATPase [Adlercreutzia sp.]